jgi:hypothetical protein
MAAVWPLDGGHLTRARHRWPVFGGQMTDADRQLAGRLAADDRHRADEIGGARRETVIGERISH